MSYRYSSPFRTWNASALGKTKTEEPEEHDKINISWRRDSYPSQRGKSSRGRGTWKIDNRPFIRQRRYTMPDSSQDHNYNYHNNYESNKYNQWEEDNPIVEEPRNLSISPESDYDYNKESDREEWNNQNHQQDETFNSRKYSADNIYRPPKSRSASYTSSDDGSQSRSYSINGSKKYEPEHHKVQRSNSWERKSNNEPDQAWTHDKYETLEYDSDSKNKDASTPVSPLNINNEFKKINTKEVEVTTCEKTNKPESPKDQTGHPKVITININELTKKSPNTSPIQENLKNEVVEVSPEITSEVNLEITRIEEELPLINLDEDDDTSLQPIQPRISEDLLSLDWDIYQKDYMKEQLKLSVEQQTIQTTKSRKLDTGLKEFDSLS